MTRVSRVKNVRKRLRNLDTKWVWLSRFKTLLTIMADAARETAADMIVLGCKALELDILNMSCAGFVYLRLRPP